MQDRKLVIVDGEAEIVRAIFRRYAELGSVRLLKQELEARGINSKAMAKLRAAACVRDIKESCSRKATRISTANSIFLIDSSALKSSSGSKRLLYNRACLARKRKGLQSALVVEGVWALRRKSAPNT